MSDQTSLVVNEQTAAVTKAAKQRIYEIVRVGPIAMSKVKNLLKNYYPLCDATKLLQDKDFEIVQSDTRLLNGEVLIESGRSDDKEYWKPFWKELIKEKKIEAVKSWEASNPEKAKKAREELVGLLSQRPIELTELGGGFGRRYDIPKPITVWISQCEEFVIDKSSTNPGRSFCMLKTKREDRDYWSKATERRGNNMNVNSEIPRKQKPFFCGKLRSKKAGLILKKEFDATEVVLAADGRHVDDIPLKILPTDPVEDGEFVIGINASNPFVFFNNRENYPVQVLLWTSFIESDGEPSLEKYFQKIKSGRLSAKTGHAHIIGNKKVPGHVIITDEKLFLKGFLSHGEGDVEYSGILKFDGDFSKEVVAHNQATEMIYKGMPFAMLVPWKGQSTGKHSVLDCDGWVPFVDEGAGDGGVKEKQLPTAGEAMSAGTSQKDDGTPSGDHTIMPNDVAKDVTEQEIQTSESSKKWLPEELEFLDKFLVAVKECGFDFSDRDIARLHTSVKCGRMIVLGGAPGVGKSSIIEMYARCVGAGDKAYLPIAVSPSWAEPADILGDEDLSGKFKDARCGLARYIREANLSEQLRAICFEEMNLACAEHYFSDLMQVVSKPLDEEVNVPGYDRAGLIVSDLGQTNQPSPLTMPPNIRVFGTCNFDITTHPFSARFYDRCSYVELSSNMRGFPDRKVRIDKEILKGVLGDEGACVWDWKYSESEVVKDVSDGLNRLADLLVTTRLYPSPRVLGQMKAYIVARPPIGEERKMTDVALQLRAFDEALAQYVFSKYTPDLNHEVRNEQAKLMEQVKGCGFEMSSSLLGEIDKRLNGFSVE